MYPQVAQAIAQPLGSIDKITMYGSGNTARLTEDVTKSFKQVIDGIGDSLGIDPAVLISSFAGSKLAGLGVGEDSNKQTESVSESVASTSEEENQV